MPAIILLCRGLFGKNIWTLNFRHNPLTTPSIPRNRVSTSLMHQTETTEEFSRKNVRSMKQSEHRYALRQQPHHPRNTKIELIHPIFRAVNEQKGKYITSSPNSSEENLDILAIVLVIAGWY